MHEHLRRYDHVRLSPHSLHSIFGHDVGWNLDTKAVSLIYQH